jgi:8-oxo-dGTP pyrophosphatase MutT (NUDIX family)
MKGFAVNIFPVMKTVANRVEFSGVSQESFLSDATVVRLTRLCDTSRLMVREFSAGGVVLRKMRGRWFVAAIEPHMERPKKPASPRSSKRTTAKSVVLALPKGAIDPGERAEQTAIREVHEETGVHADLVTKLADTKYFYVRTWGDKARVFKIVSFFLLLYRSGRMGNISPEMRIEVQNALWLPLDEAPTSLSYKGEREVASLAQKYVTEHPDLGEHATDSPH